EQQAYNYEYRHKFSCNLIAIKDAETNLFGFKNLQNQWVIKPAFYEVKDCQDNVALVWEDHNFYVDTGSGWDSSVVHEEWAVIDNRGGFLTPKYKVEGRIENGYLIFEGYGFKAIYNKQGKKTDEE